MKNFCLYNGKKIVKPDIWNITSVELSGDYANAIIQAESKSNKSEYTLDITPLISNQYEGGLDPYSATIVNELTGVSDWVLDPTNNRIKYHETDTNAPSNPALFPLYYINNEINGKKAYTPSDASNLVIQFWTSLGLASDRAICGNDYANNKSQIDVKWRFKNETNCTRSMSFFGVANPAYDPNATDEKEEKYLPLDVLAQKVISNAESGDTNAQVAIISTFNNMTDGILNSDYSEFFEQNKQPK